MPDGIAHGSPATADDLQYIENVLEDTPAAGQTRRWVLKRAALGAAGIAAAGSLGPVGSALASTSRREGDSIKTVIDTAVTAEAFAVAFLDEAIKRAKANPKAPAGKAPLLDVLRAAGAAEFDHFAALSSLGAKPLVTTVGIPDALFGNGGIGLFEAIELAEALFINAYLIGITVFANAKQGSYARYAGEILGTECEHRALARFAQNAIGPKNGHVANDRGFEVYRFTTMAEIVGQLKAVGIGFGTAPKGPGKVYPALTSKPATFSPIFANKPDPKGPLANIKH